MSSFLQLPLEHFRIREAPTDRFGDTLASPLTDLRFQLSVIADGKTPDSKPLNVSTYIFNTSNGPEVRRSLCSIDSSLRAARELKEELNRAGQIFDRGNWIGKSGEIIGKRALVLYSREKTKELSAVILLKQ